MGYAALGACNDGTPTEADNVGPPGVHIVSGTAPADTIDAPVAERLTVEVRDNDGHPMPGVYVVFDARPSTDPAFSGKTTALSCVRSDCEYYQYSFRSTAVTDDRGRVTAKVKRGTVAGRVVMLVYAPTTGKPDSIVYQVNPGNAVRVIAAAADTTVNIGASATLRGRVVDRYGNTRAELTTSSVGSGAALEFDAATGIATGREMGVQWLYVRQGTFVDSIRVRVLPAGRLLAWSTAATVDLVNIDGTNRRTIASVIESVSGGFPAFNASRQGITVQGDAHGNAGLVNTIFVVDTSGFPRREIDISVGFTSILTTRQLADGSVLVVGLRNNQAGLWRIGADNSATLAATLPGMGLLYGGADISHDGTRVAYVSPQRDRYELRLFTIATANMTVLEPNAQGPRWSRQDDKIAFIVPQSGTGFGEGQPVGIPAAINADKTGRRSIATVLLRTGYAWSPDGTYLIGHSGTFGSRALQLIRASDGVFVSLNFPTPDGSSRDYWQVDWR